MVLNYHQPDNGRHTIGTAVEAVMLYVKTAYHHSEVVTIVMDTTQTCQVTMKTSAYAVKALPAEVSKEDTRLKLFLSCYFS